ncbi:Transcriptional regulator [Archaeoglobus sulfaticallidus PM70-1]|uniref:Transcriptional regulator n=1 Tax=Archaeoglobus sulfaticallidus PM70-1 TaxID=387631 RepID=N0BA56_9EURY|nr:Lrp/AsnC family transcriptional regulator [Archaeoglobus sulfaticallidus]AGK60469.1 Transcriptional regulator [Archaeoglobus sulfaticallidus PM70-1]
MDADSEFKNIINHVKKKVDLTPLQLKILYKISEHGEVNMEVISKELGVPKSTVYYNYKKLEDSGLIRKIMVDLNDELLGLDITAISFVRGKYAGATGKEIGEKISAIPGVVAVYYILGDIDYIVISKALNREDLKRIIDSIANIEGVERTSTQYVLNVIKEERDLLKCYPFEVSEVLFSKSERVS